jgi:hypothetical protein
MEAGSGATRLWEAGSGAVRADAGDARLDRSGTWSASEFRPVQLLARSPGLLASRSAPDCAGSGGAARSVGAAPGSMSTGAGSTN